MMFAFTFSPSPHVSFFFFMLLLRQFLLRVQTSWVQAIDNSSSSTSSSSKPPLPSSGPKADWWPSLCLELASLLQVNPDILIRHLVYELYNQGLDFHAEQVKFLCDRLKNKNFVSLYTNWKARHLILFCFFT